MNLRELAWSAAAALVLVVGASAQTLILPNGTLLVGETIKVAYDNPALAGQPVDVTIEDGNGGKEVVTITLDSSGYGFVDWVVPSWDVATFSAQGAAPEVRDIDPPPAAAARDPRA